MASIKPNHDHFLSWDDIQRDCRALAHRLIDEPWKGIIAITRGGMIPAAILARELELRVIDTLCIASYRHQDQGEADILKAAASAGDGQGYLLVDDLVDTGNTATIAKKHYPRARFICLYAKPKGQPLADDYCRAFAQDVWLHFPWDSTLQYAPPLAENR